MKTAITIDADETDAMRVVVNANDARFNRHKEMVTILVSDVETYSDDTPIAGVTIVLNVETAAHWSEQLAQQAKPQMSDKDKANYAAYLAKCAEQAVEFAGRVECRYCSTIMAASDENKYWECPECGCRIHMAHAQLVALPANWREQMRTPAPEGRSAHAFAGNN